MCKFLDLKFVKYRIAFSFTNTFDVELTLMYYIPVKYRYITHGHYLTIWVDNPADTGYKQWQYSTHRVSFIWKILSSKFQRNIITYTIITNTKKLSKKLNRCFKKELDQTTFLIRAKLPIKHKISIRPTFSRIPTSKFDRYINPLNTTKKGETEIITYLYFDLSKIKKKKILNYRISIPVIKLETRRQLEAFNNIPPPPPPRPPIPRI